MLTALILPHLAALARRLALAPARLRKFLQALTARALTLQNPRNPEKNPRANCYETATQLQRNCYKTAPQLPLHRTAPAPPHVSRFTHHAPAPNAQVVQRSTNGPRTTPHVSRTTHHVLRLLTTLLLTACLPLAKPTLKIALVGPFEGRYRDVGYEVIYAVRLAVREANAAGGVAGYTIDLMAFDDGGDEAAAIEQARKLATDPLVLGVVGHWLDATTQAAAPVYAEAGIPFLATTAAPLPEAAFRWWPTLDALEAAATPGAAACFLPCGTFDGLDWLYETRQAMPGAVVVGPPLWGQPQFAALAGEAAEGARFAAPAPLPAHSADPGFADRYRAISNGVEPRANAVLAYDAAQALLAAIAQAADAPGDPTRESVAQALASLTLEGLSGPLAFTPDRDLTPARVWLYQWQGGTIQSVPP